MPNAQALQLTPQATGAIAILLLLGTDTPEILAHLSAPNPSKIETQKSKITQLPLGHSTRIQLFTPSPPHLVTLSPCHPTPLDDALLLHTAPNRFELHLHGGTAVTAAVLNALQSAGTTILTLEQTAHLGFLGTTLQAELQLALPNATTPTALRLLLNQPQALRIWAHQQLAEIENRKSKIKNEPPPHLVILSPCHLVTSHTAAQHLLARSAALAHLLTPPRIAIIGPPNAGKSTLANALLGRPISITSNLPGTTRDWVDAHAIFTAPTKNFPEPLQLQVRLVDTAGIRPTSDPLESESIARTHHQAAQADLLILLFDATHPLTPEDHALITQYQTTPHLIALNKSDALPSPNPLPPDPYPLSSLVSISALHQTNLDILMQKCIHLLNLEALTPKEPFLFTERQRQIAKQLTHTPDPTQSAKLLDYLINI